MSLVTRNRVRNFLAHIHVCSYVRVYAHAHASERERVRERSYVRTRACTCVCPHVSLERPQNHLELDFYSNFITRSRRGLPFILLMILKFTCCYVDLTWFMKSVDGYMDLKSCLAFRNTHFEKYIST